ncbi:hypothetical protein [Pontibacter sp. HSC-36F09]|uniref:hypothetical protein n=1 Tax=Pontibacter sp. HSC-36F09 TaxID=2910966 RepID=UPI00209D53CE|nr:hypothetical protein [Pontibacter sp. HSC-36F09]MCP2044045.1 hypothetical protein [Pontibacter sp. HSC-36F09]
MLSDTGHEGHYTNTPYGSRYSLTYGVGVQTQLITEKSFIIGAQVTAEQLRSNVEILSVFRAEPSSVNAYSGEGKTVLKANFLNLQPYMGKRLRANNLYLDLTLGTDIGFNQKLQEKGEVTLYDGSKYETNRERSKPGIDLRPRLGMTAWGKHVGLSLSYAHGLTNYQANMDGGNSKVYIRAMRLGLLYRL